MKRQKGLDYGTHFLIVMVSEKKELPTWGGNYRREGKSFVFCLLPISVSEFYSGRLVET